MKRIFFAGVALLMIAPTSLLAQGDAAHRQVAADFLATAFPPESFVEVFSAIFDREIEQLAAQGIAPAKIDQVRAASRDFAVRIANDPEMEERMVSLYVEAFTVDELRTIIDFYETPEGAKALRLMPDMMQRGAVIGQEIATKHQAQFLQEVTAILQSP